MSRERLNNRRPGTTFDVRHPGDDTFNRPTFYSAMIGYDAAGVVKEVFLSCNKLTTPVDVAARDIATLISIALQHGATLDELASAMTRGDKSEPQGVAGAVLDAMIHEIAP